MLMCIAPLILKIQSNNGYVEMLHAICLPCHVDCICIHQSLFLKYVKRHLGVSHVTNDVITLS